MILTLNTLNSREKDRKQVTFQRISPGDLPLRPDLAIFFDFRLSGGSVRCYKRVFWIDQHSTYVTKKNWTEKFKNQKKSEGLKKKSGNFSQKKIFFSEGFSQKPSDFFGDFFSVFFSFKPSVFF